MSLIALLDRFTVAEVTALPNLTSLLTLSLAAASSPSIILNEGERGTPMLANPKFYPTSLTHLILSENWVDNDFLTQLATHLTSLQCTLSLTH